MPAKLVVTLGASKGQEHWIEAEVIRIGRGRQCDIRVDEPGVAPIAAALEYSSGRYTAYNQSSHPLRLGGLTLPPQASLTWPTGQELHVAEGVALRLDAERDPAPSRRQATIAIEPIEPEPEPASPAGTASAGGADGARTAMQLAVIVLCLLCVAAMFAVDMASSPEAPPRNETAEFLACIKTLAEVDRADVDYAGPVRRALQDARRAELRGDTARARLYYNRARDRVLAHHPQGDFEDARAGKLALDFAVAQLLKIESQRDAAEDEEGPGL